MPTSYLSNHAQDWIVNALLHSKCLQAQNDSVQISECIEALLTATRGISGRSNQEGITAPPAHSHTNKPHKHSSSSLNKNQNLITKTHSSNPCLSINYKIKNVKTCKILEP